MKYISDINEGDAISEVYLCKTKNVYKTKTNKNYYSLVLQDKSGILDAKIWDLSNAIEHFDEGDYIYVMGSVQLYRSTLQLSITRLKNAREGDYEPSDYMLVSPIPKNELLDELDNYIAMVDNTYLKSLISKVRNDDKIFKQFVIHPAAKSVHHGFLTGLLHHTVRVMRLCNFFADTYNLNKDILLTSAFFHDVGKLYELSEMPCVEYTIKGQLLGHIAMGYEIICGLISSIKGFPEKLEIEIKHCILSHHGKLEYGSPKVPASLEALALHLADLSDSRIESMSEAIDQAKEESGLIGYSKLFETTLYKS